MSIVAEKKRPGRRKNPESKRSQGADRHTKPRLAFHLDEDLLEAMERYIDATRPRPTTTAVLVTALEEHLKSKGYWPPSGQAPVD